MQIQTETASDFYDLCIVGAGIAGLNCLFVAAQYLTADQSILLVDRKDQAGGMWNNTYDYVRLHQPHPMFTVGNMAWDWRKPKDYLATGAEVRAHLHACLNKLRDQVNLTELYGYDMVENIESDQGVTLTLAAPDGAIRTVKAGRMINAAGLNVQSQKPLAVTSQAVSVTTPEALQGVADPAAPCYIIGGGKTAMDTVMALSRRAGSGPVRLVKGVGTVFAKRETFAPLGLRRWWDGQLTLTTVEQVAMYFDGVNETAAFARFRETACVSPTGTGDHFLFGFLSQSESDAVAAALDQVIDGYLADVIDKDDGPLMVMRDGTTHAIPAGSVLVTCTGHFFKDEAAPMSCLSDQARILTISASDGIHFLSTVSSYFLAHVFLSDAAKTAPLAVLNLEAIGRKDRQLWFCAAATQAYLNTQHLVDILPTKILQDCGADVDQWFPMARRVLGFIRMNWNRKAKIAHCEKVLKTICKRCDLEYRTLAD